MNNNMSLFRCSGCRQYSSEDRYGELSGVTYTTRRFFDYAEQKYEQDEEDNRCSECGQPEEDFDEIDSEHVERLLRKLDMPLDQLAGYLNEQH